ncbi:SAM-dependent methyltransferase [Vibrio sp. 10N.286.49.B3]|uniref:tRNA (adenine(22)-N(1))-methyltransferase n=1 Tax=Vibrio sp. 10N.286.49.B3 TaxID=1880855 RepID=UPI000C82B16B|nr:tRNA (adenine(22)-N(1))-methyltransferase TrmK [Vibrio sp. 10N.286.49.B3]PMH44614.1 SAM-dependent methyltransferase [Vibrio sp. 10N.286.49.B3]
MKLSKRLQQIESMVGSEYQHIWDCCCDHGYLGAALLSRPVKSMVHFVDIVPKLMLELEENLQRFFPKNPHEESSFSKDLSNRWQVHCHDVAALPLQEYPGKHLIIIAGVGGDLMMTFIAALHENHPSLDFDLLLCPIHHQYHLRQQLQQLNFSLNAEYLIEDNQRIYEVLFVSNESNDLAPVSTTGESIWQPDNQKQADVAQRYLDKTLVHYQKMQRNNKNDVQNIVDAYKLITIK